MTSIKVSDRGACTRCDRPPRLPDETLALVRETISREAEGEVEAHDLRTRHAGRSAFVAFHLIVPGGMTVNAAHDICDRIEAA